jgi:hypothetical protein
MVYCGSNTALRPESASAAARNIFERLIQFVTPAKVKWVHCSGQNPASAFIKKSKRKKISLSWKKSAAGRYDYSMTKSVASDELFQIAYISTAADSFTREELLTILRESNQRNARDGITGMLLYKDRQFMHVLEGTVGAVKNTFNRIGQDPRHRGLIVLFQGPITERQFPGWSMAFRDLESAEIRQMPGYSEFLNTPLNDEEFKSESTRCKRLLALFKRNHP